MTVSRHKRRVSTTRALVLSLAGIAIAVVFGVVGGVAIYNTEDGQAQGSESPEDRFPETPTGMIAVVDGAGQLGSLAVFAVRPASDDDAAGGTLVPIPVSADVSGGFGDERTPLNETVSMFGAGTLTEEVPTLLGLSLDASAVLTAPEAADLLAPLGSIPVDLPVAVTGADGQQVAPAGPQTLDPAGLAAVLAASDPDVSAGDRYAVDVAVWRAIAEAIGDGLDQSLTTAGSDPAQPVGSPAVASTDDIATLIGRLSAGPIGVATLGFDPVTDLALNPRGVDAVNLDRPEVVTLFAHVAPNRMAAPNPGYTFLIRSAYPRDQLGDGPSRYDIAYAATAALLDEPVLGNVLSVDTTEGDDAVGATTVVEVSDPSLVDVAQSLDAVLGPIEVRVAQRRVAGIDMVVDLGTDYLAVVAAGSSPASPPPATATPATTPTSVAGGSGPAGFDGAGL